MTVRLNRDFFPETIPEVDIHETCAAMCDELVLRPAVWYCYPAGLVELSGQQIARLLRAGLKAGLPDLWFFYQTVYCIELKRVGGRLSKSRIVQTRSGRSRIVIGQVEMFADLLASGAVREIAIAHSVDEMLEHLERWGIPLKPHHRSKPPPPPMQRVRRGGLRL